MKVVGVDNDPKMMTNSRQFLQMRNTKKKWSKEHRTPKFFDCCRLFWDGSCSLVGSFEINKTKEERSILVPVVLWISKVQVKRQTSERE